MPAVQPTMSEDDQLLEDQLVLQDGELDQLDQLPDQVE